MELGVKWERVPVVIYRDEVWQKRSVERLCFVCWLTVDPLSFSCFSFVSAIRPGMIQLTINKYWAGNSRRFVIIILVCFF